MVRLGIVSVCWFILPLFSPLSSGLSIGVIFLPRRLNQICRSTSLRLQLVLDGLVHGWGEKYGPILHGLGLNSPDGLGLGLGLAN
jgi:hypothetical protein